jgi:glucosamine 6-phosphate synthetase-like amidotransferase/phosphosugar isomerase protein
VGYAYRSSGGHVSVHKQRTGASAVLERLAIPADVHQVLLHVRDYTKGHPRVAANNHPVRHGTVVGIHNGTILNDDELMSRQGFQRAEAGMTVDSEVIFATAEATGSSASGFEDFRGSMAAAWLDERHPELLYLARGVGRPLWVGTTRHELFFASTRHALEIAEGYTGVRLRKRELAEGTLAALAGTKIVRRERFTPDPTYEADPLPAVRAPHEGAFCLQRLAALAST